MESRIVKLKSDFNNIITIRNSVKNIFDTLLVKIGKLKLLYSEFIKDRNNQMFIFGLDSFYFQSKLIDIEYEDMKRQFLAINNRMYCEYFKLHKIITEYILKNIPEKKQADVKENNYPIYKDLEPFKEYKIEIILDIHENILSLLSSLISILNNRENELEIHRTKQSIGLNIDNFITTFSFQINVLREKIVMFITYIEFFHKMHNKYLKRFNTKIQLMHTHITNDIKFDESVEMTNEKKEELLSEFDLSSDLLKSLKKTINSEASSVNGDEEDANDNEVIKSKSDSIDIIDNSNNNNNNIVLIKTEESINLDDNDSVSELSVSETVVKEEVKEEAVEEPAKKPKRTYKPRKK